MRHAAEHMPGVVNTFRQSAEVSTGVVTFKDIVIFCVNLDHETVQVFVPALGITEMGCDIHDAAGLAMLRAKAWSLNLMAAGLLLDTLEALGWKKFGNEYVMYSWCSKSAPMQHGDFYLEDALFSYAGIGVDHDTTYEPHQMKNDAG